MPSFTGNKSNSFRDLDLHRLLVQNPESCFMFKAKEESAKNNIFVDDILIIDRSLTPIKGDLVIAIQEGELLVACFDQDTIKIWGKITYIIHKQ